MSKAFWDLDDTSKHWDIERQLKGMLEGSYRAYNGVYPNSVENIKINSDGTADVDLFGKDEHDESGHYHFHLKLYENGTFDIRDCHKK